MIRGTIYTDPFSGTEILLVQHKQLSLGVVYDPRYTTLPIPFSSGCDHCLRGRQHEISPNARNEIKLLLSKKSFNSLDRFNSLGRFEIPTKNPPLHLVYWKTRRGTQRAVVVKKRRRLNVTQPPAPSTLSYEGDLRAFQDVQGRLTSPILYRCLRFLFSRRTATPAEISACFLPMVEQQRLRARQPRTRGGRRLPCREIDWSTLLNRNP